MATAPHRLTLDEFHIQYAGRKPYYEYWFGEAIQKPVGTWLHALLQRIVAELLARAGYKAGTELELRIDPEWEPVPDVAGSLKSITTRYPTEPVDIVVEILSPDDRMSLVMSKCRRYGRIGIAQVFVLDSEEKAAWCWKNGNLETISEMQLANGSVIPLSEVWRRLETDA